jgi:hypothetical protein
MGLINPLAPCSASMSIHFLLHASLWIKMYYCARWLVIPRAIFDCLGKVDL